MRTFSNYLHLHTNNLKYFLLFQYLNELILSKSSALYILIVNLVLLGVNVALYMNPWQTSAETEVTIGASGVATRVAADGALANAGDNATNDKKTINSGNDAGITAANIDDPNNATLAVKVEFAKLKQEYQQQRLEEALRQQLQQKKIEQILAENQRLVDKISTLDNQVNIQESYLLESQQQEKQLKALLQKERLQHASLSTSPINRIKTSIVQQPDLLKNKKVGQGSIAENNAISDQDFIDIAIENNSIKTDIVDSNEAIIELPDRFTGAVEFGFNYEQDNQITKNLRGRLILDYDEVDQYNINSDMEFEFESEDNEDTAQKLRWQLQGNYNLDPMNLAFVRSDIKHSQFASYKQEDTFTVGYGHIFFNENNHKFNTEFGPGYKFAEPNVDEDEVSINEFILRTRLNYERIVSESLQVSLQGVFEVGHSNSVYGVEFKAQNRIYQQLYLIFDVDYEYNQNVPEGTENKEVSTGFNIQYAF